MNVIDSFTGDNIIYSNFYPVIVYLEGIAFSTVEHAFQASKSTEHFFRKLISALPADKAGLAKKRGRTIKLRPNWDEIKINIMLELLCQKFNQEPFKTKLLSTEDAEIIEGNTWDDNFWGDCTCYECRGIEGQNWLGILIMDVRSQIIERGNCYRGYSQ